MQVSSRCLSRLLITQCHSVSIPHIGSLTRQVRYGNRTYEYRKISYVNDIDRSLITKIKGANLMEADSTRAIAIVGAGAMLPDAPNAPAFWQNIVNKRYSIIDVPPERWSIADYYDPDPSALDKTYSKIGGWVRGFQFDWKTHRIPPKVAAAMDEGQQWAVTIAAEALAHWLQIKLFEQVSN